MLHACPVHGHVAANYAYALGLRRELVDLGAVQQGLCGHAAAVQAGAAYLSALCERDLSAELRRPYCRDVAARPAADDQHSAALGGLFLRLGRGRGGGRGGIALALRAYDSHGGQAGHRPARGDKYPQQHAGGSGLHVVRQLVRRDGEELLALLHRLALLLVPAFYRALGHGQAELRHYNLLCHTRLLCQRQRRALYELLEPLQELRRHRTVHDPVVRRQ